MRRKAPANNYLQVDMLKFLNEYNIICICDNKILVHRGMTYERFLEIVVEANWQVADVLEYDDKTVVATIEPIQGFVN